MKTWYTPRRDRREQRAKRHRRHGSDASGGWRAEYRVQRVALPDGGQLQHADADTDRQATRRAEFLERTTRLSRREALALAYSELGFSSSGIAKQIDSSESTVKTYLQRATATYGPFVPGCQNHFVVDDDLEPVDRDEFEQWADFEQEMWASTATRHPDRAPDWFPGGES